MKKRRLSLLSIFLLLFVTTGCWDLTDINNTAFVMSMGIDTPSDPDKALYEVTLEFARPLPSQESQTPQNVVVSAEADSILQALQKIQTNVSRKISLSHLRLIAIGEGIAKRENFQDITNYLMREPDLALQLRLVFAQKASARDLFYMNKQFAKQFATQMVETGLHRKHLNLAITNNFLDFITDLNRTNGVAIGTRVSIKKDENIVVYDGAAVFKDWKLDTWLSAEEAQAANWLVEKNQAVIVAKDEKSTYTYRLNKMKSKIKPILKDGNPSFLVAVTTEGMVMEESGKDIDLSKPENLEGMEKLFSDTICQQVESAIDKSQKEIKADYLGFGEAFERYKPKAFRPLNWKEIYPTVPVEIQVNSKVKAFGLRK